LRRRIEFVESDGVPHHTALGEFGAALPARATAEIVPESRAMK